MKSFNALRDELKFVGEFRALFDVIQQVAMAQLHRLDEVLEGQPRVSEALRREFFPLVPASARRLRWVRGGDRGRLVVVVTSEEGMAGPLYGEVARRAQALATPETHWVLLGSRGLRALDAPKEHVRVIPMPEQDTLAAQLGSLAQWLVREYRQRRLESVWLVAAEYRSPTRHEITAQQVLPLPLPAGHEPEGDRELIIEPSAARAVQALAAVWAQALCRDVVWSARRAECAARALHMEDARQQLGRRAERLRHGFFKAQHERVDVMVRESCVIQRLAAVRRAGGR